MDETQTPPTQASVPPAQMASPSAAPAPKPKNDAEENRWYAVLAYCWILFLIPLLSGKKSSPFVQFHLKQGIVMFLAWLVLSIIGWYVPGLLVGFILFVCNLALFILAIFGIIHAYQGDLWELPLLGDLAKKIKL